MNGKSAPPTLDSHERPIRSQQALRTRALAAISLFGLAMLSFAATASPPLKQSDTAVRAART